MKTMNSTDEFFLDNPWESIKTPCYPDGRRLYLHDERFWVSRDDNYCLLFFLHDSCNTAIKPLENIAGLSMEIEAQPNGCKRLICRLTSREPELEQKFTTIAKDIAFHCSGFSGVQLFLNTQDRIKSWANFLKPSHSGLTNSEFIGFFGEIYTLSEHLLPSISPKDSIQAWIGPEGKKQDFTLNEWAIEVKTSFSGDQKSIRISSLDQLDKVTKKLYLLRVVASPASDGDGFSLQDLYNSCLSSIGHDVIIEGMFLQKVSKLYGKANKTQLNQQLKVSLISVFDVTEKFPKITQGDVDISISEASYQISIGALSSFEINADIKTLLNYE